MTRTYYEEQKHIEDSILNQIKLVENEKGRCTCIDLEECCGFTFDEESNEEFWEEHFEKDTINNETFWNVYDWMLDEIISNVRMSELIESSFEDIEEEGTYGNCYRLK